jgi:hypothetical protein
LFNFQFYSMCLTAERHALQMHSVKKKMKEQQFKVQFMTKSSPLRD